MNATSLPTSPLAATGIPGLDDVLAGGLTPNGQYLLEGVPGSGKSTLGDAVRDRGVHRGQPAR